MTVRLRLKTGYPPERAITVLREAAQRAREIGDPDPDRAFNTYRAWVEATETQLASLTVDPAAVTMLLTRRHFLIHDIGPNPYRLWGSLYAERDFQAAALDALAADLQTRVDRAAGDGEPVVLDTNVLLHYELPDNVPWAKVLGRASVRLVVPLRVVEELDEKKYGRNDLLASRARNLLPWLERAVTTNGGRIRDDATLEVPVDTSRRTRPESADREILDECHELHEFGGQGVTLVTGDTSMRLRARAESIVAVSMPDDYRRTFSPGASETSPADASG